MLQGFPLHRLRLDNLSDQDLLGENSFVVI